MTDLIAGELDRRVARLRIALWPFLAIVLAVATAGGAWLSLVDRAAERPSIVAGGWRPSLTLVAIIAVGAWGGIVLARRTLRASGAVSTGAAIATTGTSSGFGAAVAIAAFGLSSAGRGEAPLLSFVRDLLVCLPATAVAATSVCALLAGLRPWQAPAQRRRRPQVGTGRRLAFQGSALLALVVPVALVAHGGVGAAVAEGPVGSACPAGAPLKQFAVAAIDVDITLNRFGDHDPIGRMYALESMIPAIRAQEATGHVSIGLRDDPIQPLVVRANLGDCVEFTFRNAAQARVITLPVAPLPVRDYGMHIDGIQSTIADSGEAVGRNPSSQAAPGETLVYRYYIPEDPALEGTHYIRPGPGYRAEVSHGLFGALAVQPKGSVYLNTDTGQPLPNGWGWEATIVPPQPAKAFRENVHLYHEVGDEAFNVFGADGLPLPQIDDTTGTYRPGARAINYRSEPFRQRLLRDVPVSPTGKARWKSLTYNSYTYGDPATPISRGYLGDPTKKRILHAGSEIFHVYHLHGGGIRWRFNPVADTTFSYQDTGLDKSPKTERSPSTRLDSQSFGPGESYSLEIEGGAGGVQQSAGDFLEHCHIAKHYNAGMWNFWRVYDTRQDDLARLPDREVLPTAVNSIGLIGRTMPDGTVINTGNLDDWIRPQLPAQGAPIDDEDASVWDWTIDTTSGAPRYLGEPAETEAWPNLTNAQDGERRHPQHRGLLRGDSAVGGQNRPEIKFNPNNGRPAFPLLRPNINQRAPFAPKHGGAPWLGERGSQPKQGSGPDPWANRPDGICPGNSPVRKYNIVAIQRPVQITRAGGTDPAATLFVLAGHKQAVINGTRPAEPLAIRANVGECVKVILTTEATDGNDANGFAMQNIHIHHVQFDVQASDGVGTGMQFGQAVRPYQLEDRQLSQAAAAGDTEIRVADPARYRAGIDIAVGMGTDAIEVHRVVSVNIGSGTIALATPLATAHAAGEWAGSEFVQYTWYPDVQLDNIFWHDHVDGIHGWGHGAVGQLVVEPRGSTYHDPKTGAENDGSGTIVDIHTNNPLVPGVVDGSFREFVFWTINETQGGSDGSINLRSEPIPDRNNANGDPSLAFSSYTHGDPFTPIPRAYRGDPMVLRGIDVSGEMDSFFVGGHRFTLENGFRNAQTGEQSASQSNALLYGVSERFTLILGGGAGGLSQQPGDYLYGNVIGRRIQQGAWGVLRVLPRAVADLQPLPGRPAPGGPVETPLQTGGRPPATADPGNPCPGGAPVRRVNVSAVDVPLAVGQLAATAISAAFVPSADAGAVASGVLRPEPLVIHAAVGDCLEVQFTNRKAASRSSFMADRLVSDPRSSGINIGFSPEQSVAPGESRLYRYFADGQSIGAGAISEGTPSNGSDGAYGAIVVAPTGARFTDPYTGVTKPVGTQVDVRLPNGTGYRDFTVLIADKDERIGADTMPYASGVGGLAMFNYRSDARPDGAQAFSSVSRGDPTTGLMRVRPGDSLRVHAVGAPGSEAGHVFSLGGLAWPLDPALPTSIKTASRLVAARTTVEAIIPGGDKSPLKEPGDHFVGDLRRPFTNAGVWSLLRVVAPGANEPTPVPLPGTPGADIPGGAPGANAPGAGGKKGSKLLFRLQVASRIKLTPAKPGAKSLGGAGVPVRFQGPGSIRAVRIELVREVKRGKKIRRTLVSVVELAAPKRLPKTAKARASLPLVIDTTGKVQARWRIPASVARKIASGKYVVRVRAGTRVNRLYPDVLTKKVQLVGGKGK